jgi:hypothetical protein
MVASCIHCSKPVRFLLPETARAQELEKEFEFRRKWLTERNASYAVEAQALRNALAVEEEARRRAEGFLEKLLAAGAGHPKVKGESEQFVTLTHRICKAEWELMKTDGPFRRLMGERIARDIERVAEEIA